MACVLHNNESKRVAENTKIIISAVDKTRKGFSSVTSGLKKVSGAVFNLKTALLGTVGAAGFGLLVKVHYRRQIS